MKKLILLSILATSFLAAPAVQAQMGRGQRLGNRSAMPQNRAAWTGNHGFPRQGTRLEHQGQRFEHRNARAENRNNYHRPWSRQWARGPYQHPGQHKGWSHSNARPPYQARAYGNYRPPFGPAAYGPRTGGYNHGPQGAYGPGSRPYNNYNTPPNLVGPGARTHNGYRPPGASSGIPGTITRTSVTPFRTIGNGAGRWTPGTTSGTAGTTSGTGWNGHQNTRISSGATTGGTPPVVTAD
jgi:Ni/Co efflux regulator RcnB